VVSLHAVLVGISGLGCFLDVLEGVAIDSDNEKPSKTLKMATTVFAETLENLQYFMWFLSKSH
jgi:hypothetical protein